MTNLRRVLAIVTRSFYYAKNTNKNIRNLHTIHLKKKSPLYTSALYSPSTRLLHHHYHKYSSSSSSPPKQPSIALENKSSRSSFTKRLIFIASVTTLSYIGYKYIFSGYDDNTSTTTRNNSIDKPKSITNAISQTAQKLIEDRIISNNLSFKIALFFDNKKSYDKALYFYKLYLRKPNTKQGEYAALNNMAIIYYKLNQYENALIVFELLGKQQIRERNLEFLRAHCYHSLKQYDKALKNYHLFLQNHRSKQPDITAAYNNLALLYYELGRYDKAIEYFNKIGDEQIISKNYGFRVAHSLQNVSSSNNFEDALKYYNIYLQNPQTTSINLKNAYHNLGVLFYDNGKDKEAMDMFKKLGEDELSQRNLEFKMAHLCAKNGDKPEAIKYLKQCKNKPEVYGEYAIICQGIMAQILYEINEYKEACKEFDELGEKEICKQDLYFPAAFSYNYIGEYDKALRYYRLLLENKRLGLSAEEIGYIQSRIGLIYYKQRDYLKTLDIMENNVMENEMYKKWNCEFILAHSNHKCGRFDKAIRFYNEFLKNPNSDKKDVINCYQNMGLLYYDLNQFSKTIEYFQRLSKDGNNEEIITRKLEFYMGHSYQEMGDNENAMEFYKLFLKNVDKSDNKNSLNINNAYNNLGVVYYDLKQYKDALTMFLNLSDAEIVDRDLALKVSKCYGEIGDTKREKKYLKLATNKKPKHMDKCNMAKTYYNMYQNELAIKLFNEMGDEEIKKNDVEFIVAHSYQLIGDTDNAIKYYLMGIENNKNKAKDAIKSAYHNMGCAYHDAKKYKEAIECFGKLPIDHIIATNMEFIIAVSYHNLEMNDKALEYYQLFLNNPKSRQSDNRGNNTGNIMSCYNNMVVLYYYKLNDYEKAWNCLNQMGENNIIDKKLEYEIAHCAQQLKKNDESMRYYRLFLKNNKKKIK